MLYKQLHEYNKPEARQFCSQPLGSSHLLPATSSSAPVLLLLRLPAPCSWHRLLPHTTAVAILLTVHTYEYMHMCCISSYMSIITWKPISYEQWTLLTSPWHSNSWSGLLLCLVAPPGFFLFTYLYLTHNTMPAVFTQVSLSHSSTPKEINTILAPYTQQPTVTLCQLSWEKS